MTYANDPMGAALDRYITGNWGEDQFKAEDEFYDFMEHTCNHCFMRMLDQCPVDESEPHAVENCLIVRIIIDRCDAENRAADEAMAQAYFESEALKREEHMCNCVPDEECGGRECDE